MIKINNKNKKQQIFNKINKYLKIRNKNKMRIYRIITDKVDKYLINIITITFQM